MYIPGDPIIDAIFVIIAIPAVIIAVGFLILNWNKK